MEQIKAKISEFYTICKEECYDISELDDAARAKIKSLYGYQLKGQVFANPYNLVFYDFNDAKFFANILPSGSILAQITIPEFDVHLVIIRYAMDAVLSSVIGK
jgi:hypothetical protein